MQSLLPVGITARKYQQSIADSAINSNTLVVLPTGLGKTTVALLVSIERLAKYPKSKAIILAPTKPLVLQHQEFFKQHYPNANAIPTNLTGESPPNTRTSSFQESSLIFATPEVIRNDVIRGRYDLADVSLIVFDEAHRCVRDYAYSEVAAFYKSQATNPLILGLTASPSARKTKIEEICDKLAIVNVESRIETDEDVTPYVKEVSVNWERLQLPSGYKHVSTVLRTALEERIGKLRTMHQLPADVPVGKRMLLELGERLHKTLRHGRGGALFGAVLLQSQAMSLTHAIELLETQGAKSAERFLSKLENGKTRSSRGLSRDSRVIEAQKIASSLHNMDHPKQQRLKELLLKDLGQDPKSKIIVFTQFRDTVETIVDDLRELDHVFPVRFVGQATKSEDDPGLSQVEQVGILEEFRQGKYNVLVTTSIGEEGLHVPDVDHVIFYEAVPSEIRMIQRRGRTGRTRAGKTTVLITEGTVDEAYYWSSRRKEKQMRTHLETIKKHGIRKSRKKTTLLDYA